MQALHYFKIVASRQPVRLHLGKCGNDASSSSSRRMTNDYDELNRASCDVDSAGRPAARVMCPQVHDEHKGAN